MTDSSLRETEIRPDELMREQQVRFERDVQRMLARRSEFLSVPCPACSSTDDRTAWTKYGMSYVECSHCETVYISPRPSPEVLRDYYTNSENYEYWNRTIFPASESARREKIFRPRAARAAEICRRHGKTGGVLLEVGAGFGTFCEEMRELNAFSRIVAVEPTPGLAATCRKRGLEVIEQPIENVSLDFALDVVVSFEVIEHLFDPAQFLRGCHRVLSPGGLLILTCPNIKGFDMMVLRDLAGAVDAEHLNYFHPASLARLLDSCGFKTIESLTPGKLDAELVRKKILSSDFDVAAQPFLRHVLVDEWDRLGQPFQEFLAASGLSSHMWIVAEKIADPAVK
jgi:2-polyprenyl-3-methyl-5-hydroxy-6-metoxy-1,4-benzoquinol methylase/ribosomal protein S27E